MYGCVLFVQMFFIGLQTKPVLQGHFPKIFFFPAIQWTFFIDRMDDCPWCRKQCNFCKLQFEITEFPYRAFIVIDDIRQHNICLNIHQFTFSTIRDTEHESRNSFVGRNKYVVTKKNFRDGTGKASIQQPGCEGKAQQTDERFNWCESTVEITCWIKPTIPNCGKRLRWRKKTSENFCISFSYTIPLRWDGSTK